MTERERFEKWYNEFTGRDYNPAGYESDIAQAAWQAALEGVSPQPAVPEEVINNIEGIRAELRCAAWRTAASRAKIEALLSDTLRALLTAAQQEQRDD